MVETSELRHLPIFAGLPDDQIAWFISQAQEVTLQPDEIYVHQGDPAEAMFVLREGQLHAGGEIAAENIAISSKAADFPGLLPFFPMMQVPVASKAIVKIRSLRFPAPLFPDLVQKTPELAIGLVARMSDP